MCKDLYNCASLLICRYYPQHMLPRHVSSQCGEHDAASRQAGRSARLGPMVLTNALQWLTEQTAPGILVLRSPAVHSARSYVSDAEYETSVCPISCMVIVCGSLIQAMILIVWRFVHGTFLSGSEYDCRCGSVRLPWAHLVVDAPTSSPGFSGSQMV
jgi:hypothetical protein